VAKFWRDGALHQPAAEDCTTCHQAHGSDFDSLTRTSIASLCSQCHEQSDESFADAHQGIKPGADTCVTCHDPHGGPEKNLLYPVSHTPFSPTNCKDCHEGRDK
jgi:predicted CXXCH cytochrome family protein